MHARPWEALRSVRPSLVPNIIPTFNVNLNPPAFIEKLGATLSHEQIETDILHV